jgi:hypothetical protein
MISGRHDINATFLIAKEDRSPLRMQAVEEWPENHLLGIALTISLVRVDLTDISALRA